MQDPGLGHRELGPRWPALGHCLGCLARSGSPYWWARGGFLVCQLRNPMMSEGGRKERNSVGNKRLGPKHGEDSVFRLSCQRLWQGPLTSKTLTERGWPQGLGVWSS